MPDTDTSHTSGKRFLSEAMKVAKKYWSIVISVGGLVAYLGNPSWFDTNNKWIVSVAGFLLFSFGAVYGMQSAIENEDRKAENERKEKVALLEAQAAIEDRRALDREKADRDAADEQYERDVINHARRIPMLLRDTLLKCIEDGPQMVNMMQVDSDDPGSHFRSITTRTKFDAVYEKVEVDQRVKIILLDHPELFDDVSEFREDQCAFEESISGFIQRA